MGFFRFRRSIKIAPGIRWNLGKRSSSISFGGKGFHYTVGGPRGSRTTVGIPGTGLSYTETSGHSSRSPEENTGCTGCLGQIILFILVVGGISMCTRSEKDSAAAKLHPLLPRRRRKSLHRPQPPQPYHFHSLRAATGLRKSACSSRLSSQAVSLEAPSIARSQQGLSSQPTSLRTRKA